MSATWCPSRPAPWPSWNRPPAPSCTSTTTSGRMRRRSTAFSAGTSGPRSRYSSPPTAWAPRWRWGSSPPTAPRPWSTSSPRRTWPRSASSRASGRRRPSVSSSSCAAGSRCPVLDRVVAGRRRLRRAVARRPRGAGRTRLRPRGGARGAARGRAVRPRRSAAAGRAGGARCPPCVRSSSIRPPPTIASRPRTSVSGPRRLEEFVGQVELKEHLSVVLEAARRRGQAADHLLFAGPPGVGKTSLSGIVAVEMGVRLHVTSGPALERAGDLAAILTKLEDGDVLFIDEIHRLSRAVEEILYPAMEDFQLDIVVGKGPAASSIRLTLPRFTLVGATTRTGLLTGPLRDRFGLVARLDFYAPEELEAIVTRAARHPRRRHRRTAGAWEIARRSRGTPRIANRLLRRVRDFAEVRADGLVDVADGPRRPGPVRRGRAGPRQGRPRHPRRAVRPVRRRPGGALDPGHQRQRADRDGRGRLRALPHPAGPPGAHAPRPAWPCRRRGSTSGCTPACSYRRSGPPGLFDLSRRAGRRRQPHRQVAGRGRPSSSPTPTPPRPRRRTSPTRGCRRRGRPPPRR